MHRRQIGCLMGVVILLTWVSVTPAGTVTAAWSATVAVSVVVCVTSVSVTVVCANIGAHATAKYKPIFETPLKLVRLVNIPDNFLMVSAIPNTFRIYLLLFDVSVSYVSVRHKYAYVTTPL